MAWHLLHCWMADGWGSISVFVILSCTAAGEWNKRGIAYKSLSPYSYLLKLEFFRNHFTYYATSCVNKWGGGGGMQRDDSDHDSMGTPRSYFYCFSILFLLAVFLSWTCFHSFSFHPLAFSLCLYVFVIVCLLSLVSAFSQINKTYKIGLGVWVCVCVCFLCVCVCVCVCVCLQFWSPLTISKPVIRLIRNFGYIQYRTGTLQRHWSRFLILKIVPGRNFSNSFFLHLINMGKFSNSHYASNTLLRSLKCSI